MVKLKPARLRWAALMLQRTQIEKPRNSAKIEKTMFLRAMNRPFSSQKPLSSGFQFSIQAFAKVVLLLFVSG